MPRCMTYRRRSNIDHDRPSPLTCRHRRSCGCERSDRSTGQNDQGKSAPAPSSPAVKPWESEEARAVLRALDPYPAAKDALIDAIRRIYQGLA